MYRCFEDYGRFVCDPIATKRLDEVVSEAVGGLYTETGEIERDGCLASVFGQRIRVDNLGVHVVQPLLDCPKRKSPSRHRLVQHQNLSVPSLDRTADFVCAFSVFAQLLHSERYLYLEDMPRVLRPGGRCPFSFLEFGDPRHSHAFLGKVETRPRRRGGGALFIPNSVIERPVIEVWAHRLGYTVGRFVEGSAAPCPALGQSIVVFLRA